MRGQVENSIVAHDGKRGHYGRIGNRISRLCGCALIKFAFVDYRVFERADGQVVQVSSSIVLFKDQTFSGSFPLLNLGKRKTDPASKPAMALVSVSHPQSLSGVSIAAMQDVTRMKLAFQEFYTSCFYPSASDVEKYYRLQLSRSTRHLRPKYLLRTSIP